MKTISKTTVDIKGGISKVTGVLGEGAIAEISPWAYEAVGSLSEVMSCLGQSSTKVMKALTMLQLAMNGNINDRGCDSAVQAVIAQAAGKPYFDLSDYMGRTWLVNPMEGLAYNARVHKIMRSDHDRCLHDHPWHNASIVLQGGYWEVMPGRFQNSIEKIFALKSSGDTLNKCNDPDLARTARLNEIIQAIGADQVSPDDIQSLIEMSVKWRGPLSFTPRLASSCHRLIIPKDQPAWSLFVMRPKLCAWGFITADGWVDNEPYLKAFGKEA